MKPSNEAIGTVIDSEEICDAKSYASHTDKHRSEGHMIFTISKLAREYGVSRKKLARRWNGLPSRSTRPPTNRLLSSDQDTAPFLWLEYLDNIAGPPTNE